MSDVVSKSKRSRIMRSVKSKDTKIEIFFRKKLWAEGIRYRKNPLHYFGKPDLVIKKYRLAFFVDSCFWHGCKEHMRQPKTNKKYWESKIKRNTERDKEVNLYYKKNNWHVIRVWEHDLRNADRVINLVLKIIPCDRRIALKGHAI